MKKRVLLLACAATLIAACSQKQAAVEPPATTLDVEALNKPLDYAMDISGLSLADLRVLRHAPAARQGLPFKDAYLRGIYSTTTWYDSLMWAFDERADFSSVKERDDEPWRDYYYRACEESGAIKYTDEERTFMQRLQEREDELRQQNFKAGEGLRVNIGNLLNPQQLKTFDAQLAQRLAERGFAVVPAQHAQLFHVYEQNDYTNFPSFVTTDLYLQLHHLYADCMLREIEQQRLDSLMACFAKSMYATMHAQRVNGTTEGVRQAALHNAIYFSIAYKLLTGKTLGSNDELAGGAQELQRIVRAENATSDFIAEYSNVTFPYSLFRPRGHYTRSEQLQRYFRGMMWLQSVPFGIDSDEALLQALVMADGLNRNAEAQRIYDQVNRLLTLLMGQPDDLAMPVVQQELKQTGKSVDELTGSADDLGRLRQRLNTLAEEQTRIRPKHQETSRNKVCLMPQRYQPDAEVLLEMVDYDSEPTQRATPKGLDVMAAMGISAAEQLLKEEQTKWKGFEPALTKMKARMKEIDWTETMATQWLQTLQVMAAHKQDSLPYFMLTPEWQLKDLNAVLASWAELKHDAILYAKQPMGAECGGGGPPAPVVKGYVEPNTAFWQRAKELLEATAKTLKQEGVMTEKISQATDRMSEELKFLLAVSKKELKGTPLTDEEYDQIGCIGATFENISLDLVREPDQYLMGWDDVQGADRKVALVADVYTANAKNNPQKSILFEAVGAADEIFVVVEVDGYLYLTRGAVFSYREFTQPIDQPRLTDEEWQQQIEKSPRKGQPQWMERIIVPIKEEKKPEPDEEFFYSSGC